MDNETLKDLIAAKMDIESFMDFLNLEFREVLDALDYIIEENNERLTKELA